MQNFDSWYTSHSTQFCAVSDQVSEQFTNGTMTQQLMESFMRAAFDAGKNSVPPSVTNDELLGIQSDVSIRVAQKRIAFEGGTKTYSVEKYVGGSTSDLIVDAVFTELKKVFNV